VPAVITRKARCTESVMSLPARELRVLSGIETALQAGEARLTLMFAIFTRLAADEGKPGTEDLGAPARNRWAGRPPVRLGVRLRAIALVAVLAIASAVFFSVSAGSVPACGPAVLAHTFERAPSRATACPSPLPASRPTP
jgi:hypothetical protein